MTKPDPDDGSPERRDLYERAMIMDEEIRAAEAYQVRLHALVVAAWPTLDHAPEAFEAICVVQNSRGEWSLRWYCPHRGYERSVQYPADVADDEAGLVEYLAVRYAFKGEVSSR